MSSHEGEDAPHHPTAENTQFESYKTARYAAKPFLSVKKGIGLQTMLSIIFERDPTRSQNKAKSAEFWHDVELAMDAKFDVNFKVPREKTLRTAFKDALDLYKRDVTARKQVSGVGDGSALTEDGQVGPEDLNGAQTVCKRAREIFTSQSRELASNIVALLEPGLQKAAETQAEKKAIEEKRLKKKSAGEVIRRIAFEGMPRNRHEASPFTPDDGEMENDSNRSEDEECKENRRTSTKKARVSFSTRRQAVYDSIDEASRTIKEAHVDSQTKLDSFIRSREESAKKKEERKLEREAERKRFYEEQRLNKERDDATRIELINALNQTQTTTHAMVQSMMDSQQQMQQQQHMFMERMMHRMFGK